MHNFESGAFNFGWRTLNVKPIEENMANFKFLTAALVAGSVLATPAIAQERKTLFQVLFPKAHEKQT